MKGCTVALERRASSARGLAELVVRLRVPLALLVLALTALNRVVLHQVALPRDWAYLLVGWLPAVDGTLEMPWEAPWLVLPIVALVLFVARPRVWAWALVVLTFVLPHFRPYSIGGTDFWGVRIVEFSPEVVRLLHAPLGLLLLVLAVLAIGGRALAAPEPRIGADRDETAPLAQP